MVERGFGELVALFDFSFSLIHASCFPLSGKSKQIYVTMTFLHAVSDKMVQHYCEIVEGSFQCIFSLELM